MLASIITGKFQKLNNEDIIEPGDVVCINDNGLVKKIECESDLTRVIGIASSENNENEIEIGLIGTILAKTKDKEIVAGDLLVANIDSTVRVRNACDEDVDIIGMAMKKPEHNKVLIKIK